MVKFGKLSSLLKLAVIKLYDIFFITIKLGNGWILIIDQNKVNLIHIWISAKNSTCIVCFYFIFYDCTNIPSEWPLKKGVWKKWCIHVHHIIIIALSFFQ